MTIKENSINQQFEKLTVNDEFKSEDDILDDAIVNGMKSDHKPFCLQVETFLNNFMKSSQTTDIIGNLDKYQRKIVHKICDIYNVKRDYVDVKPNDRGDITISKTEESRMPTMSLETRYSKLLDETKKQAPKQIVNPFANKKLIIKPRESKKTGSDSDSSDGSSTENAKNESKENKDDIEKKKQLDYEKAREKIMQEQIEATSTNPKVIEKPKKKGLRVDQTYDPDYDRSASIPSFSNNNLGYYPPQYNMYYQYQGYPQSQVPFGNGYQSGYGPGPVVMQEDNRQGYASNFPSLASNGRNFKKK